MERQRHHKYLADVTFDGGSLDCGNGLLLLIRKHIDPMMQGQLLEIRSTESSVEVDLPAWCRLTANTLVSWTKQGDIRSFLVAKGEFNPQEHLRFEAAGTPALPGVHADSSPTILTQPGMQVVEVTIPSHLPAQVPALKIEPLSVTGIGSWPRPDWLLRALHDRMEGRISEDEFQRNADDAVRLCVEAQLRAGVDVLTDGEQRRDNYSSFVGGLLDNCALIPLTDLLPLVDDPEKFQRDMQSLDVAADKIRHPAVFGKLGRSKELAVNEYTFARGLTDKPIKIALPGPYLLTRTMWMECISEKVYASREDLAFDIVRVLREEIHFLLAAGVSLVQLDEPVLTEVVFGAPAHSRSFMCGALSERGSVQEELSFATALINDTVRGLPAERLGMHVCRGNWSPDQSMALEGDYHPLLPLFCQIKLGTLFLEFCTTRAGDVSFIKSLPDNLRVGLGVTNPKDPAVESVDFIVGRAKQAIEMIGPERLLLNPDCGFATFADNPVASTEIAQKKLAAMTTASTILRNEY